jgi:four helix bundle protein
VVIVVAVRDFRELEVWGKAHRFVLEIYTCTAGFPVDERFGLTQQLRRCSSSIASNIAEGAARRTDKDFARFVSMAIASASEAEYQLLLARDLGYLDRDVQEELSQTAVGVRQMLIRLAQRLAHSA